MYRDGHRPRPKTKSVIWMYHWCQIRRLMRICYMIIQVLNKVKPQIPWFSPLNVNNLETNTTKIVLTLQRPLMVLYGPISIIKCLFLSFNRRYSSQDRFKVEVFSVLPIFVNNLTDFANDLCLLNKLFLFDRYFLPCFMFFKFIMILTSFFSIIIS